MNIYEELSVNILKNEDFKRISEKLFNAYVFNMIGAKADLTEHDIVKLVKSIQIFHLSVNSEYTKKGAELLSMLLNVIDNEHDGLIAFANRIFCEAGNFPNMSLIKEQYPEANVRFNLFDELNMEVRRLLNTVSEIDEPLTDYQRNLWHDLTSKNDVLTSAPTSTGKTYLILKYLIDCMIKSDEAFTAIVVPTRALISEISNEIYKILKTYPERDKIGVVTVPQKETIVFQDRTFFVMTQERLFEILQLGDVFFNYLFIDEAHNIASDRGVLLHLTLQELLINSRPQIIISMPSEEYKNSYDSIFSDIVFHKRITNDSPVSKILISLVLSGHNINVNRFNESENFIIQKGFSGNKIEDIVLRFGANESNIIFRNTKNACEIFANGLAGRIPQKNDQSLNEAADYIEKFLHKDFTLAKNLRHGVAFHYGALPSTTRLLIEALMRNGNISFLACTSTLAEGINLPAKNLFLDNPKLNTEPMENVQVKNVVGRAGRMLKHFAGNVFLINPQKWDNDYDLNDSKSKVDKIPTFYSIINDDVDGIMDILAGGQPNSKPDTYYAIANKLISEYESDTISKTFNAKELELDAKKRNRLLKAVAEAYSKLNIEPFVVQANPSIGYIQQDKLHDFLLGQKDLTKWVLPFPKSPDIYKRLVSVLTELNNMGIFFPSRGNSIKSLTFIACQWLQGKHLNKIITSQISWFKKIGQPKNANTCIRSVIKALDTDIRFKMASVLKCYNNILNSVIASRKLNIQSTKLHTYIEIGGCEERFVNLVSIGLSRDTSIEINNALKHGVEVKSIGDLRNIYKQNQLNRLHTVMKKEVERLLN